MHTRKWNTNFVLAAVILFFSPGLIMGQSQNQPISALMMGQSYYYTQWTNPRNAQIQIFESYDYYTNSPAPTSWTAATLSGSRLYRIGGNQYNIGGYQPQSGQEVYYVSIIDDIRKHGGEPVLTIPFLLNDKPQKTPEDGPGTSAYTGTVTNSIKNALNILHLVNDVHQRNLRYIVLANEPDVDYSWTTDSWNVTYTTQIITAAAVASNIAGYVKPIAQAIKEKYPNIKIIGPEYSYFRTDVMKLLFSTNYSNPECIAGLISSPGTPANNLPYIDYASYHCYYQNYANTPGISPGSYSSSLDWQEWMAYTDLEKYGKDWSEVQNSPDAPKRFRGALRRMKYICDQISLPANSGGRGVPLKFMITEMNPSAVLTASAPSPSASALDSRGMLSGQILARMYALGMEYGATSMMMWSVKEGGGGNWDQDRGYLDNASGGKRSTYFHYKMMADYFKGTYYRDEVLGGLIGTESTTSTSDPNPMWLHYRNNSAAGSLSVQSNFIASETATFETKAFAASNQSIAVMILNHSGNSKTAAIRFDGNTFTTTAVDKNFRFAMGKNSEIALNGTGLYSPLDPNSTTVLILDCGATAIQARAVYRGSAEATSYNQDFAWTTSSWTSSSLTPVSIASSSTCLGSSLTLSLNNAPSGTYNWTRAGLSGSLGNLSSLITSTSGLYVAQITPANTSCSTFSVSAPAYFASPLANAGSGGTLCGTSATLAMGDINLPAPTGTLKYTWTPGNYTVTNFILTGSTQTTNATYVMTASDVATGCSITSSVTVIATSSVSLMIRDYLQDTGIEPSTVTPAGDIAHSPDIWTYPLAGASYSTHINPAAGLPTYVKVRITNIGCVNVNPGTASVTVYHAKSNLTAAFPTFWNSYSCSNFYDCANSYNTMCGDKIGTAVNITTLTPSSSEVVELPWTAPDNPDCGPSKKKLLGWCLLAHLDHPSDPLPLSSTLSTLVAMQASLSNNIATKNIIITPPVCYESSSGDITSFEGFIIRNETNDPNIGLNFTLQPDLNGETILDYGQVEFFFTKRLVRGWKNAGSEGSGIIATSDSSILLLSDNAVMNNIPLDFNETAMASVKLSSFATPDLSGGEYFAIQTNQFDPLYPNDPLGGFDHLVQKDGWCCVVCDSAGGQMQRPLGTTLTANNDTIEILNDVNVSNGDTLRFSRSLVKFSEHAKINLQQGGVAILENCILQSSCPDKLWNGLEINGSPLASNCLTITGCYFKNTNSPVTGEKVDGAIIEGNTFVGEDGLTSIGIQFLNSGSYSVCENQFAKFNEGVFTNKTYSSTTGCRIDKNNFQLVNTGIRSQNDNHSTTSIRCNKLSYKNYGIVCDSSLLCNFGSSNEGAGNEFKTLSTLANNKVSHTSGNTVSYYYDPSMPVTAGLNLTSIAASSDRICYSPYDSLLSPKPLPTNISANTQGFSVLVIPNPNSGEAVLKMNVGTAASATIVLTDLQGRRVADYKYSPEQTELPLSFSTISNGVYIIEVTTSNKAYFHSKVIVQK